MPHHIPYFLTHLTLISPSTCPLSSSGHRPRAQQATLPPLVVAQLRTALDDASSVRVPAFDQLLLNPFYSFEHIVSSHESLVALYYYHPQALTDTLNAVYVPSSTLYFS